MLLVKKWSEVERKKKGNKGMGLRGGRERRNCKASNLAINLTGYNIKSCCQQREQEFHSIE